ncbi:retrovirus-related pol polyprotein from transposon TNT 1-94 [Tanacetum coccineum]
MVPCSSLPTIVIKFLKQIQVGLNKTVRFIRTDNGTEFVIKTLYDYYESVEIFHQKTVPRTNLYDYYECVGIFDSENLGKLQPRADIGIFIGYAPSRKGPAPNLLTLGPISSGLVPNPAPALPYVPLVCA